MRGFSIDGHGYVEGGFRVNQNNQYKFFDNLYEYDPASDTWIEKASFPGGKEAGEACFVINDKAYIGLGQFKSNYNKMFYAYDPSSDTWSSPLPEFPADGRELSYSFSLNNIGYVMLGYNSNKASYYDDVWQFSISGNNNRKVSGNEKNLVQYEAIGHTLVPLQSMEPGAILDFNLYDITGRLIWSEVSNSQSIIHLPADIQPGVYLIETFDGKSKYGQKMYLQ